MTMTQDTVAQDMAAHDAARRAAQGGALDRLYRRVDRRVVAVLAIAYLLDCIDRMNIGFAQHQIAQRIGLSTADYGVAAGIFFIGYVLFEIPSNLLLPRVGARRTFFRIMVLWGLASAAMGLLHDRYGFYVMRFLLGVFEAGFAPACMYYLTLWYPRDRMATVVSVQQTAGPLSGAISGPLSGFLLQAMDHVGGLDGWRWMFVLEGLPSVLMGVIVLAVLCDRPADARWLSPAERAVLTARAATAGASHAGFRAVLRDRAVYVLSLAYFCLICGLYTINFWLPAIIRRAGVQSDLRVGLLSAMPYLVATGGILLWGCRSDRARERRWHSAIPAFVGAAGLLLVIAAGHHLWGALAALSATAAALYAAYVIFLSVPSDLLKGPGAAGGYALINSLGLLGGFLSPMIIGQLARLTGSLDGGLACMSLIVALGGVVLCLAVPPGRRAPAAGAALPE